MASPLRAAIVLCLVASACSNPARRQAAALSDAIDRYRRAENPGKAERAGAVVAVACTDAEVCATKQACMAAISSTVRALQLKDEVTARLADLESKRLAPDAPDAVALPGKLDDAERLLKEGHDKMGDCEVALTALRLHHAL